MPPAARWRGGRGEWDETLFAGAAPFYERGRAPYPPGLVDVLRAELELDGSGVLVDFGAGPGTLAGLLAPSFARVLAIEPDPGMAAHGRRSVADRGIGNVEWRVCIAESSALPPASVDVAIFGQSFHWMDQPRVAAMLRTALRAGGRLVLIGPFDEPAVPWQAATDRVLVAFLGAGRRAGRRVLLDGTPSGEEGVLAAAGYAGPLRRHVPNGCVVLRDVESVVAWVHSRSSGAPHLFGERLAEFDARLRAVLAPDAPFTEVLPGAEVRIWQSVR